MTGPPIGAPQPPPPPPTSGKPRPRWGILDTWPAFILVLLTLLSLGVEVEETSDAELAGFALFVGAFIQQLLQGAWPVIVSRWKGLGIGLDWKFRFDWKRDIGLGLAIAVICIIAAQIVNAVVSAIVGLGANEDASNTNILSDNQDSSWLIGIIILVVIGAPLTEELLFRGLVLRAFEKYLGVYVAVAMSTILFAIPHYVAGSTTGEAIVLWTSIGTVGLIFGLAAVRYDRLGPAIIGHFFFNAFGTTMTLIA